MLNDGYPAEDPEAVLVTAGFLRSPSELFDIEAGTGTILVQSSDCGVPGAPG